MFTKVPTYTKMYKPKVVRGESMEKEQQTQHTLGSEKV